MPRLIPTDSQDPGRTAHRGFLQDIDRQALSNLFGRSAEAEKQVREMRARIGTYRGKANLVLVSHGSTASALTGVAPQQAEIVVLTPLGGSEVGVAGRLGPSF